MVNNKRLACAYIFTIILNIAILITIKILFSANTNGLGGIGKGIVLSFLSLSSLIMYIGIVFLSPNKKVFLIIHVKTFVIAIVYVLFLNIHSNLVRVTNKKVIQQLEGQMRVNDEYFEECLKNIANTKKILLLIRRWKNETKMIENNIQFIRPFIVICFLVTFNYEENELQLDNFIREKFPRYNSDDSIENLEARKILQNTFDYAVLLSEHTLTLKHDLICKLYQRYYLSSIKYQCHK